MSTCYSALIRIGGPLTVEQAESIMRLTEFSESELSIHIGELVPAAIAFSFGETETEDEPGEYIELFYPEAEDGEPDILDDLMKLGVAFDCYRESTAECDAWGQCFRPEVKKDGFYYEREILWHGDYQFVAPVGRVAQLPPVLEPVTLKGE